jgi:diadenosine tetraphosphatase ApaH/serine/threonine PP2A family protein phosphatase
MAAAHGCTTVALILSVLAGLLSPASANAFLGRELPHLNLHSGDLVAELERALGHTHRAKIEVRAGIIEESLRPTFQALPRDERELLHPAAVRYLLHRQFVDRHGWFVLGFDTEGEAWNSSSPTQVFGGHGGTQGLFEERIGSRGLSLHEVSLLAATLESFVHAESTQRLHSAYDLAGMSKEEEHAKESDVEYALDTYMMLYLLALNHTTISKAEMNESRSSIHEVYPTWNNTADWIREVRKEVVSSIPEARNSFNTTLRVVEEIAERYGRWQDKECIHLKESLLKMEQPGTGRVPLAKFYEAALNGAWQFSENKAYLQQSGALDDTDQARPSVVIPNYINAPANCVASSKFYSVCCINECEALLGYLERKIASPFAPIQEILELVEQLPSSTVEAPRKLPQNLVQRLEEIATHHGGQVPFHGRLFSQWLHHAYPRECPYPHLSGVFKPITPERWSEQHGEDSMASEEDMRWHVEEMRKRQHMGDDKYSDELPWSSEEELFISRPETLDVQRGAGVSVRRGVGLMALACAMTLILMQLLTTAKTTLDTTLLPKVSV